MDELTSTPGVIEEPVVEDSAPVVEASVEEAASEPKEPKMPRKGRDTFLADKEELEKEVCNTPSLGALAKKAGVSYTVLMNWLRFQGVDGPAKDDRAVAKFYDSVEEDEVTGCWIWKGKSTLRYQGKSMNPVRFAASIIGGVSDLGRKRLVHTCGNELCVNPEHLALRAELDEAEETVETLVPEGSLPELTPAPESVVESTPEPSPAE